MEISTDPYEQKLYHMFKSYDINSNGSLDKDALIKLCKTLELNEKSKVLVKCLLGDANKEKVTFREFKDGLLKFLGNEMLEEHNEHLSLSKSNSIDDSQSPLSIGSGSPLREISPKFMVGAKKYGRRSKPQHSELNEYLLSDSDNEQVNLSKPSSAEKTIKTQKVQRSASQSDIHGTKRHRPVGGTKLKRCASLPAQKPKRDINTKEVPLQKLDSSADSLGNLDFENISQNFYEIWMTIGKEIHSYNLNHNELAKVCKLVGLNKIASKMADEVYEKLEITPDTRISFNNFIALIHSDTDLIPADLYNNSISTIDICDDSGGCNLEDETHERTTSALSNESTVVPAEVIIEMWESAGVPNASNLLLTLGFSSDHIKVSDLSNILDEELYGQTTNDELEVSPVLRASLALHKAEVNALRQALRQLGAENRKLFADNRDANNRAALLAQEIDERHATLENSTKSEIKILEQRHADMIRDLTEQLTTERENLSSLNIRLENRIKFLETEDIRYKNEITLLKEDKCALELEQTSLHKQLTELLESNIKLNNELVELEDKFKNEENFKHDMENEEVLELIDKISSLQVENSNLRDKNDELSAEIEGLNFEISKHKNKKLLKSISQDGATTDVEDNIIEVELNQCVAVKRRGDSPSKTRVTEESPRLGKLRKCNADDTTGTESETSGDWIALNSELCQTILTTNVNTVNSSTSGISQDFSSLSEVTASKDEEIKQLKDKLTATQDELHQIKNKTQTDNTKDETMQNHTEDFEKLKMEKKSLETRCNDLESSLEQMRKEYEDCEDYWQSKLNEERLLYEEEQRISDEKFNELLRKMAEYEEQCASSEKDGRLSPIEENCKFEQQFAELESEMEEIKLHARKLLEEKDHELNQHCNKIKSLEKKLTDNHDMLVHTTPPPRINTPTDVESSASSPISYLWSQSTIQNPARDYQNPNWNRVVNNNNKNNLETPVLWIKTSENCDEQLPGSITRTVSPIQKPISPKTSENGKENLDNCDNVSVGSERSNGGHSIASTYNVNKTSQPNSVCPSPNSFKEDLKRLKLIEIQLKESIKTLGHQRDSFVMEIQQLQEAKPVLEKAYARAAHPSLTQRIQQLEQKNRHLQNSLRQQNQYVENIMHQTWQQQRAEINELRNRLETQNIIITEQAQRLANADILVKDLYVENSHLQATIQRLEQQRTRGILQMQHQQGINDDKLRDERIRYEYY